MNDQTNEIENYQSEKTSQPTAAKLFSFKWFVQWACLLATVFLAGATINCLFSWLSYGNTWDLMGTFFSLILTVIVYFAAFNTGKIASIRLRFAIAAISVVGWAILFPAVMRLAGFK
ncbi:MAG: hypothetical protein PWR01_2658 [Clostridiales bacterium]|jgi:hypothetical protein|nr:hypothetical protein [Clostridiales bacterium]MDN5281585.1 hypothetical protein [Candidatus Ozemobacter sp.]